MRIQFDSTGLFACSRSVKPARVGALYYIVAAGSNISYPLSSLLVRRNPLFSPLNGGKGRQNISLAS